MKILKLRKDRLDFFASVVQQFGEVHALKWTGATRSGV